MHFSSIKVLPPDSRTGIDLEAVFLVGLQSILLEAHTRFLDNGQCVPWWWEDVVVVWQMRDPDVVMTWEWWRGWWYRWWLDVRMKFVGHVSRSCEQIMWVVTCRDHVIGRSRDHDITIAFLLRRKLRWAWKSSVEEWKLSEKFSNPMRETEKENQGKMRAF